MRAHAYREVGGCEPRLFLGAEEALRGLDLVSRGRRIVRRNSWPLKLAAPRPAHRLGRSSSRTLGEIAGSAARKTVKVTIEGSCCKRAREPK